MDIVLAAMDFFPRDSLQTSIDSHTHTKLPDIHIEEEFTIDYLKNVIQLH